MPGRSVGRVDVSMSGECAREERQRVTRLLCKPEKLRSLVKLILDPHPQFSKGCFCREEDTIYLKAKK